MKIKNPSLNPFLRNRSRATFFSAPTLTVTGVCVLIAGMAISPAFAQQTWTGGGASDLVSDPNNWSPVGPPSNDGTAELSFDGNVRTTPDFGGAWSVGGLSFASGAGSFTIGGSPLTVSGGASVLDTKVSIESAADQSIQNSILLGGSQSWVSTGGNLLLGGAVDLAGSELRVDFGGSSLQLGGAASISSGSGGGLNLAGGTLELLGAHDLGGSAVAVDRIADDLAISLSGGHLRLVSDDDSGFGAMSVVESIGPVTVNDTSTISVVSSANHNLAAGARLIVSDLSFGDAGSGTHFLKTFVEGQGNRLDLGSGTNYVNSGQRVEVSTANGGVLDADFYVREGGQLDFVTDAAGPFGTLDGYVTVLGNVDFDSSGGANTFNISRDLWLSDSAVVDMTLGALGSDRVQVGDDLRLNGTLRLTEDASAPLAGSGLHTLFTYGGDLTDQGLQLGDGGGLLADPDWRFALGTGTPGEVNLVASEVRDWDGGGGDGLLSTAANWDADKALASLDTLTFDPSGSITVDNDFAAGGLFGGIELGGTNNGDLTLNGNQANLSSGITINGGNHTFGLDLSTNVIDFDSTSILVNAGSAVFNGNVDMLPGLNLKMEMADGTSVTFNGDISGSKLFKTGTTGGASQSTVTLTGVGSFDGAAGGSSITQGDLVLAGENGALVLSGNPQLDLKGLPDSQARLVLDNSVSANTDRVSDNSLIAMFGNSALKLIGNGTTGVTERMTALALFDGVTTIEIDAPAGVANGIVFDNWPTNFQRTSSNYLAVTNTSGVLGTGGANPFLKFDAGIADGTLVGRGNYNGTDLLRYDAATGMRAATTTTTTVGALSTDHVRLDANESLGAALTVESLALNGAKLDGAGTLTVSSGLFLGTTGSELAVDTNLAGSSGVTVLDARGDMTISGTVSTASTTEKWGEGDLSVSSTGEIRLSGSGTLLVQEGSVTLGKNNAITSTSYYDPSVSLRNGTSLDMGTHDLELRSLTIDQGGSVEGTGTLTVNSVYAGSIPALTAGGGTVEINPDLEISGSLTEATGSQGILVKGDTSFSRNWVRLTAKNRIEFQGTVDAAKELSIYGSSGSGELVFGDAVTAQSLSISGYSGHQGSIVFDGAVGASTLAINVGPDTDLQFNDAFNFAPSAGSSDLLARIYGGQATLGGANGALLGMEELSIGVVPVGYSAAVKSSGLVLDNSTFANSNRIDDAALVSMQNDSTLTLIGNGVSDVTEVIGSLHLGSGETAIDLQNDPAATTGMQVTTLSRASDNVLLVNASGGTLGGGANNPNLLIDDASAGFMNQTIINGNSFANYDATQGVEAVASVASVNGAAPGDHAILTAGETVGANTSIQSLAVGNGVGVSGSDVTISTGHVLLQDGASVSNNLSTAGDGFVYTNGSASLSGNFAAGGDVRKAGSGDLTVGSAVGSLSVGAGKTFFIDDGTVSTGGAGAIASGTNVSVRRSTLDVRHSLNLGQVSLEDGADISGTGSLSAGSLVVRNSRYTSSVIDATIAGGTDVSVVGGTTRLQSASTYTGLTSVDGGRLALGDGYGNGPGAILGSSGIEIGKNTADTSSSSLSLGRLSSNRVGDTTSIDLYNRSSVSFSSNGSAIETVGDVTVHDGAKIYFGTEGFASSALSMASFSSTNGVTTLSTGNNDNFLAGAVTIDGVSVNAGEIVKTVYRNDSPVEWVGGALRAVTAVEWNTGSSAPSSNFVSVTSAFDLANDTTLEYVRFDSTDPFSSTPGKTLFVTSGLFFAAEGGNTMNAKVALGANGSVSTSSIVRFTDQLTAAEDMNVIGGGVLVVDNAATVVGMTNVKDGKLVIGETNSGAVFTGDITVENGSSIGGSGGVAGDVLVKGGGITQPGNSPGTLTITGNLQYDAQSIAMFELAAIGASDMIDVGGDLTFGGEMSLQLFGLEGLTTGTYALYGYDLALSGFEFLSIDDEVGLGSNLGFDALLVNNVGNKSIDLQITSLGAVAIPEPSSTLLLVFGVAGLAVWRRRS